MTKEQARKLYLQKRTGLTDAEFKKLNQKICDQFFSSLDLSFIKVLHSFLPIEKQKEVNTWLILDRVRKDFPEIRIAIPRINNQSSVLESYYFEDMGQLERNTWGIMEPSRGVPAPESQIDAVLVPLLAVDRKGNRVGYGRGFYDKFLMKIKGKKIGLSFFPPVKEITGMSSQDIPIDVVVTPEGILSTAENKRASI